VDYNAMVSDPARHIEQISRFLGDQVDAGKMAGVIDPNLYRQRK
jgi:hypothetical protein